MALPEPSAEPGGGLSVLAGPWPGAQCRWLGCRRLPTAAGRAWHPLLRAPSRLGWGRSAAISQSNRIQGTPLCEWVLSACHLSTLKRQLTASDGQVTGFGRHILSNPQTKVQRSRRGPLLCGALVRPSVQSAPWERDPDFRPGHQGSQGQVWPKSTWWVRSLLHAGRALP